MDSILGASPVRTWSRPAGRQIRELKVIQRIVALLPEMEQGFFVPLFQSNKETSNEETEYD